MGMAVPLPICIKTILSISSNVFALLSKSYFLSTFSLSVCILYILTRKSFPSCSIILMPCVYNIYIYTLLLHQYSSSNLPPSRISLAYQSKTLIFVQHSLSSNLYIYYKYVCVYCRTICRKKYVNIIKYSNDWSFCTLLIILNVHT